MQKEKQVILAIILLLGVTSTPYLFDHANNPELSVENIESNSDSEQLSVAAEHWHQASSYIINNQETRALSGMLNLAHGSFDPLTTEPPYLPESFISSEDYLSTGMMFVQLNEYDFDWLFELQSKSFLHVLDNLGDGNFIIRLEHNQQITIDMLATSDEVRWFGNINPGYRIHPSIIYESNYHSLSLIPSNDLGYGGYESLALSLTNYGATDAWCGYTTCQVTVENSLHFANLVSQDGRIIWTEPVGKMVVHNAVARAITGVANVDLSGTFTLDGSGEMLAIADTGLDRDHPDISGRVAAVYTQFGLDTSPADTNGGHGTHVTLTAVGDGSGDTSSKGIAPSAGVTMYALEHDPTGVFGRQGSIYDLLLDAKQKTARIAINAWGLNGNFGEYTADSRSVDQFVHDETTLLPIFSVGDTDGQGSTLITAPATAKNVLSVGVSTTGSLGTTPEGSVDSNSRVGFTLDGRIKPDVVAPGVEICSGRAEEAKTPIGFACGSGVHADGDSLYMSVSGTSQSASVAGGLAALTREFIREQVNIVSPSASLIKAAMINGAEDLGTPDVPNQNEGWGQLNLENTVMPTEGSTILSTYFDDGKVLQPSFGLVYELDMDPSHGIDITLAWNDDAGSANSPQTDAKLVTIWICYSLHQTVILGLVIILHLAFRLLVAQLIILIMLKESVLLHKLVQHQANGSCKSFIVEVQIRTLVLL
ncbi:MAG: S8 family serine peptidase [Euryarchaeota archaeon]|nr:S8 family serine peptidase [Euryarchaeota archaeon]